MPLSRITGPSIANNSIIIEDFASARDTAVYSSAANTVAIRTANTDKVTVANTGNTNFANSVSFQNSITINPTGGYLGSFYNRFYVSGTSNLPEGSDQANAIAIFADAGSSRRLGVGSYSSGMYLQSSYPGTAGPAYTIALNPNGGAVGVATSNPSGNFDVNGETTWQNGVMRKSGTSYFVSVNRRVRVELSNYAFCRFRVFALRTNAGDSTVWWEGTLNNNFNTSYSTAFNSRSSSGSISYSFGTSASGVWNWDFNNSGSGAYLWYTLESMGSGTVTVTTW